MTLSFVILSLAGCVYVASFFYHYLSFKSNKEGAHATAVRLMRLGFLLSTFYFAAEAVEYQFVLPVAGLSEALAFFAWSLAFVYIVLLFRSQQDSFGLILTPFLILLIAGSIMSFHLRNEDVQLPQNPFFLIHIVGAFFAYASFTVSFAGALCYLIQNHELKSKKAGAFYHRLPSLEELEKLIYEPMIWGLVLLFSATVIGFMWSQSTYGQIWIQDPKTLATLGTVALYLVIFVSKKMSYLRPKRGAILSMVAFAVVLISFVGMRFVEGSHPYVS